MKERTFIREYIKDGQKFLEYSNDTYVQKSYYDPHSGMRGTWLEPVKSTTKEQL